MALSRFRLVDPAESFNGVEDRVFWLRRFVEPDATAGAITSHQAAKLIKNIKTREM